MNASLTMAVKSPYHSRSAVLALVLVTLPGLWRQTHAGESVAFEARAVLNNISGNVTVPGYACDGMAANGSHWLPFTYDFNFNGLSASSNLLGCCGVRFGSKGPIITNVIDGAGTYLSSVTLTIRGEICGTTASLLDVPSCFDVVAERSPQSWTTGERPSSVHWITILQRNSNSVPIATWSVKDLTGLGDRHPPEQGHLQIPADGMSQASATVINTVENPIFQFTGNSLGCSLTNTPDGAILTASTNLGTVQVTAVLTNTDPCLQRDFYFDLVTPCPTCENADCPPGSKVTPRLGSVDVLIGLGPGRNQLGQAHLQIKSAEPTPDLGTPALLRCDFLQPDLQKITDPAGALRQLRVLDGFVDILTNSASSYSIHFYHPNNLVGLTNGLYTFTNAPDRSVTIELVGGNTNHVRISESEGSRVSDYLWETNGWALASGGGLRRETRTVSLAGDVRTEITTLQRTGGPVERQTVEVWQATGFGDRLIQEVFGTGNASRTNTYGYNSNGLLEEALYWDGSWDIYHYDALGRQIEHFSPFLNSPPTTNTALCRRRSSSYDSGVVAGSGDNAGLEKFTPRRVIEYVQGIEISRHYTVVKPNERREIACPNPGATWTDTNNLVTVTWFRTDAAHYGKPAIVANPDGTMSFHNYTREPLPGTTTAGYEKVTVRSGAPNVALTDVVDGTELSTWSDKAGRPLYHQTRDVMSGQLTQREIYTRDDHGRVRFINFLDGTMESHTYDCCHLLSVTDREGTVSDHTYDALDRQLTTTRDGITMSNVWNSAGDRVAQYRIGTNGYSIRVSASGYDDAGRLVASTNALDQVMTYLDMVDGSGQVIRTTVNPDDTTVIETHARDGTLLRREGTAVFATRHTIGIVSLDGHHRLYTEDNRLLTNGTDSAELTRTIEDGLGRTLHIEFPGGTNTMSFHPTGQLRSHVDADGVTRLFAHNARGELELEALDVDRDGVIDLDGPDRVTRTVSEVITNSAYGTDARLSQIFVYAADDDAAATQFSEHATSLYDQRTWSSADGLTHSGELEYLGSGSTRRTTTAPDGTRIVELFQSGRPLALTVSNAFDGVLRQETYGYDAHNRLNTITDVRRGTTTFTHDDLDRVLTVTTPTPGPGQSTQVTTLIYDAGGKVERAQAPDGLWTTNEFHPHGLLKQVTGARVYPVDYTYDHAGRLESLTTWQDYSGENGAAVTTWKYDARGLLTNRLNDAGLGPTYTHTAAGRVATRTWARTVGGQSLVTAYDYNEAGDPAQMDYSDNTPDVSRQYDRLGQLTRVEGATTNDYVITAHGQLLSEDVMNAGWNYIGQTRFGHDPLRRRVALTNLNLGLVHNYAYDGSSRLGSVSTLSGGLNTLVNHSYQSNSPLLDTMDFQRDSITRLTTSRSHDNLNRLTAIESSSSLSSFSSAYGYNAANQRIAVTNADASYWLFGYDRLGQLTNGWRYWDSGTNVLGQTFHYSFDDIGNRTSTDSGGSASGTDLRSATYSRNSLNQYVDRTVPGYIEVSGTAASNAIVQVNGVETERQGEYFRREVPVANGTNTVSEWLITVATNSHGTTIVSRLTHLPRTPELFTYDADGNLTSDGLRAYTWDAENRLIRVETLTNAITDSDHWRRIDCDYDHLGRRLRKTVWMWNPSTSDYQLSTRTMFFYDGWNLVGQVDEVTGQRLSWLWGMDLSGSVPDGPQAAGGVGGLLAMTVHNGSEAGTYFYVYDGNGNVTLLVNAADGSEAARYEYGPFGEPLRVTGPLAGINPFRFCTKYQDQETGLLYYGYRYYSANTGRWLCQDPIGIEGGMNLYGFVGNDPIADFDPFGLALYAFDGTWNDAENDEYVTNVRVLYELSLDPNAVYMHGVGTREKKWWQNFLGGVAGWGGGERIEQMMARLRANIESGDTVVDVIGFSRGAAMAREFANRVKDEFPCVRIRFLGLFDTVASFGLGGNNVNLGYRLDIPDNVDTVVHITAADERRHFFPLSSIKTSPGRNDYPSYGSDWVELSMIGVHSDVGGGYADRRQFANVALKTMHQRAAAVGVSLGPIPAEYQDADVRGVPRHQSLWINDIVSDVRNISRLKPLRPRKVYYSREE